MRFTQLRAALYAAIALGVTGPPAVAATAQGVMQVSFTILPTCTVSASPTLSVGVAAAVSCPIAVPFRATLTNAASSQALPSAADGRLIFKTLANPATPLSQAYATLTILY